MKKVKNVSTDAMGVKRGRLHIEPQDFGKLHTPHICSFAEESLKLTRFHVGFAECAPSRASMLTSRQPQTTHVWDLYSCEHQPQSQPRPLSLLTGVRAPAATRLETQRRELHDATAVLQGARLHHEGHWQDLPLGSGLWQGGSCRVTPVKAKVVNICGEHGWEATT